MKRICVNSFLKVKKRKEKILFVLSQHVLYLGLINNLGSFGLSNNKPSLSVDITHELVLTGCYL